MNPYESGARKNIPAVLIYLQCRGHVLMIHRNSPTRPEDFHAGKWNGLGGKCELDESYSAAAIREIEEESGIRLRPEQLRFAGFLQFPNFKLKKSEDWSVMVFSAEVDEVQAAGLGLPIDLDRNPNEAAEFASESLPEIPGRTVEEGTLKWIPRAWLTHLNVWPGDREFLPCLARGRLFYGAIWYGSDGRVVRSEIFSL